MYEYSKTCSTIVQVSHISLIVCIVTHEPECPVVLSPPHIHVLPHLAHTVSMVQSRCQVRNMPRISAARLHNLQITKSHTKNKWSSRYFRTGQQHCVYKQSRPQKLSLQPTCLFQNPHNWMLLQEFRNDRLPT